jgi:hypothetical protein
MADEQDKPKLPNISVDEDNSVLDRRFEKNPGSGAKPGKPHAPKRKPRTFNPRHPNGIIRIDPECVRQLAARFWSPAEIGAFFGVSRQTIVNRFAQIIADGRQDGRAEIRDLQWKAARRGSERILLHMSQVHLHENPAQRVQVEHMPTDALIKAIEAKLLEDREAQKLLAAAPADESIVVESTPTSEVADEGPAPEPAGPVDDEGA